MFRSILNTVSESIVSRANTAESLPIFPLGSVLFPGGTLALRIFERRYMDMATAFLKNGTPFGIALIHSGREVGTPAEPELVGTVAQIIDWDMQELGILQARVRGEHRFRIVSKMVTGAGLIIGETTLIPDDTHSDCPEFAPCVEFLKKILPNSGAATNKATRFDDAAWVSFRITELLPLNNTVKQKMLELTDARMRLEILRRFLDDRRLIT